MERVVTFSGYFRIYITTKLLKMGNLTEIEAIFIEINIQSKIDCSVLDGIRKKSPGKLLPPGKNPPMLFFFPFSFCNFLSFFESCGERRGRG